MGNFEWGLMMFVAMSIANGLFVAFAILAAFSGDARAAAVFGAMAVLFLQLNMFGLFMTLYNRIDNTTTEDEEVVGQPGVPNKT